MRPTQQHLIDDTPLGLYGGQGQGQTERDAERLCDKLRAAGGWRSVYTDGDLDDDCRIMAEGQDGTFRVLGHGATWGEAMGMARGWLPTEGSEPDPAPGPSTATLRALQARPLPATQAEEVAADTATRTCLAARCGKAARSGSCFCTAKCKAAWTSSMSAWHARQFRDWTPIKGAELFQPPY